MRGALTRTGDLLQRFLQRLRVVLAGVDLALCEFGLRAQAGERCLELVRGIGEKVLLRTHRLVEPGQQVVDRAHQRRHFLGGLALVDRREIAAVAPADALLQFVQRRDAARQRQPHEQHRKRQDHELRQDHALDDLGREARALAERFGDLHQRRVGSRRRARLCPLLHADPHVRDAHRVAAEHLVAKAHLAQRGTVLVGRHRQRGVAAQILAAQAEHLVVDVIGLVGVQDLGGRERQLEHRLRPAAIRARLGAHRDLFREHTHHLAELAIERLVRDTLRDQPGQRHAHRPQQQQRREHPVEDFAEQRALLAGTRIGHSGLHAAIFSKQ